MGNCMQAIYRHHYNNYTSIFLLLGDTINFEGLKISWLLAQQLKHGMH